MHAVKKWSGWQASVDPCGSVSTPEGDGQPLEYVTDGTTQSAKALAYEATYVIGSCGYWLHAGARVVVLPDEAA